MQLKQQLVLKLQQKLQLTPQLQLAMKMLQLNHLELSELLKQEVEQNPVLDAEASPGSMETSLDNQERLKRLNEVADTGTKAEQEHQQFEFDWNAYLRDAESGWAGENATLRHFDPDEGSNIEEYVSSKGSLTEHLTLQLRLRDLSVEERKIGEYLIGLIDRSGYLRYDEPQILETLGISDNQLEKMVAILQSFDPPGIAARTLSECLMRQYMAQRDQDPFVLTLIGTYLEDLGMNRVKQVARKEGVDVQTVLDAYEEIQRLDPKPGLHYERAGDTQYITPDVFVEKVRGEVVVRVNERYVPRLKINAFYRSLIRTEEKVPKKTVSYVKERLNAAKFLMESIERRKDTIYRVTKRIFEIQEGFLDEGVKGLKPLTLRDVADHCGLHESTISRVTNSKYVQTPRGLFALKFFFSSGTTTSDGDEVSSKYVKELLAEIVGGENPRKPHSDARIVQLLSKKGIDIARRTVAKYREELGIRSSSKRKQFV